MQEAHTTGCGCPAGCVSQPLHTTADTPEAELAAKAHHRSNEHMQVMGSVEGVPYPPTQNLTGRNLGE